MKKVSLTKKELYKIIGAVYSTPSMPKNVFICTQHTSLMLNAVKRIINGRVTNTGPYDYRIISQYADTADDVFALENDLISNLEESGWHKMMFKGREAWFPSLDKDNGFRFVLRTGYYNGKLVVDIKVF